MVMVATRVPSMAKALLRWTPRLAFDDTVSTTEDPGFPDVEATSLVVCGVPRSGTTYLGRAAEAFLGSGGGVWRSHDPFVARDFLPWGVPVVVTLRPPLETAISKAIYHGDPVTATSLVRRLALTTAWHRLVAREPHHELMRAWDFADFTTNPSHVLQTTLGRPSSVPVDAAEVAAAVYEEDTRHRVLLEQTHTPRASRALIRAKYEDFIRDGKVQRYLALALEAQEKVRQNHTP
jgi:hypothetical protein